MIAMTVYSIICTKNNFRYIGSSVNAKKRLSTHFYLLEKNKHSNKKLQEDFNSYGRDCFTIEILGNLYNKKALREYERDMILQYNTLHQYNVGKF